MKRKLFSIIFVFILIVGATTPAFAQSYEHEHNNPSGFNVVFIDGRVISLSYNIIAISVENGEVEGGAAPPHGAFRPKTEPFFNGIVYIISEEYVLFPVRSLFDALGFVVKWVDGVENGGSSVTLTRDSDIIILPIDNDMFIINGQPRPIETPARIINDRTFAPISHLLAAGEFWPHEAEIYFYTGGTIAVGFNRALDEIFSFYGLDTSPLYQHHIVTAGDSLSRIAMLYFGSSDYDVISLILAANDITLDDALLVGQVLFIPILAE